MTWNLDHILSMMMDNDLEYMESFNFTRFSPFQVQHQSKNFYILSCVHVDWEHFYWTNENITSLPVPIAASRFLITAMRTDWENIDWSSIDLSALTIPDRMRAFLFTMANMNCRNVNLTGMIGGLPIPEGNKEFLQMMMDIDWQKMGWANFTINMTMSDLDWQTLFYVLNLPISEDFKTAILMILSPEKQNSDMNTPTISIPTYEPFEVIAFIMNLDWKTFDYSQMIDLSGLPIPNDIRQMFNMVMQIDWGNFD